VVWPAIVRRALQQPTAQAAREIIATSRSDRGGTTSSRSHHLAFALEASGTRRKQVFGGGVVCHTNHCLDADIAAHSSVPRPARPTTG